MSISRILDILRRRTLVLIDEEALMIATDPLVEQRHLFFHLADGLGVHVCLGDPFGHVDYGVERGRGLSQ